MSDLAKLIAEDTQDAPHYDLYGFNDWRNVIAVLLDAGYHANTVEQLMRSDWPRYNRNDLLAHLKELKEI